MASAGSSGDGFDPGRPPPPHEAREARGRRGGGGRLKFTDTVGSLPEETACARPARSGDEARRERREVLSDRLANVRRRARRGHLELAGLRCHGEKPVRRQERTLILGKDALGDDGAARGGLGLLLVECLGAHKFGAPLRVLAVPKCGQFAGSTLMAEATADGAPLQLVLPSLFDRMVADGRSVTSRYSTVVRHRERCDRCAGQGGRQERQLNRTGRSPERLEKGPLEPEEAQSGDSFNESSK